MFNREQEVVMSRDSVETNNLPIESPNSQEARKAYNTAKTSMERYCDQQISQLRQLIEKLNASSMRDGVKKKWENILIPVSLTTNIQ